MQFNDLLGQNKDFEIERMAYQSAVSMSTSHYHSHYEILYIESGSRTISINETKHIELTPNNIALLPPNIIHATTSNSDNQSRILINLSSSLIKEIVDFSSNHVISCFDTMFLPLNPYDVKTLKSYIQQLIFIQTDPNTYLKKEKIKFTVSCLLVALSDINYRYTTNNQSYKEQSDKMLNMDSIIEYISSHYYENISLVDLSKKVAMSKQHFIRIFTEKYQTTPIKYLNMFRVITAQRLLESNTMNVTEVFKACGFNSSAHFSRVFKQITGVSPKAYQLNFKNKNK